MPKRFIATELWDEDWFLEMPAEYQFFWFFILAKCDHAGVFKINTKKFSRDTTFEIDSDKAFDFFNKGKNRVRKINGNGWLIEDFFVFQYGKQFNGSNRLHESVAKIYDKLEVKLSTIRGLVVVKDRVKDKDKDKV